MYSFCPKAGRGQSASFPLLRCRTRARASVTHGTLCDNPKVQPDTGRQGSGGLCEVIKVAVDTGQSKDTLVQGWRR